MVNPAELVQAALQAHLDRIALTYAANRELLGAAIGGSDCHFGSHDIASAVTEYEGDFRSAVESCRTRPRRLRRAGFPPADVYARQQYRALVQLPLRRLRGEL